MRLPASVDIAIVNYHSSADIRGGLEALGPWDRGQVWLVDNSCDTTEAAELAALALQHPRVTVLTPNENLGFGRGCNLALAHSTADFFLLLNPDARIARADIERLIGALAQDATLGAVSPVTYWNPEKSFLLPRPSEQSPRAHLAQVAESWWLAGTQTLAQHLVRQTQHLMAQTEPFRTGMLAGAVLLLRRSAVEAAGGLFEPGYFMFFEDADLSLRLRRAGFALAMVPQAEAVHLYRHKPFKAGLMAQSQQLFFQLRHGLYLRLSGSLRGVERLARPVRPEAWFTVLGALDSAEAFAAATQDAGVEAFSPSLLMMPAIVRPANHVGGGFTAQEWALLEPGSYVAWLRYGRERTGQRWVYFVRG